MNLSTRFRLLSAPLNQHPCPHRLLVIPAGPSQVWMKNHPNRRRRLWDRWKKTGMSRSESPSPVFLCAGLVGGLRRLLAAFSRTNEANADVRRCFVSVTHDAPELSHSVRPQGRRQSLQLREMAAIPCPCASAPIWADFSSPLTLTGA